jgi:hypothetical protein
MIFYANIEQKPKSLHSFNKNKSLSCLRFPFDGRLNVNKNVHILIRQMYDPEAVKYNVWKYFNGLDTKKDMQYIHADMQAGRILTFHFCYTASPWKYKVF